MLKKVAPYWNVNQCEKEIEIDDIEVEVAPYWNVNSVNNNYWVNLDK